ncbi:FAD/NAD-P-binding domain-containing protein [Mycena venus]|uniref:FAD/NAD-P-binding domain-containing protein n=1 Tax=Mycena venus TaxID=2733690 RepID=A0A8H7CMD0_9AGAR|nr:FAD/NAD-P-binding domain-containing protein [Mycena venus]
MLSKFWTLRRKARKAPVAAPSADSEPVPPQTEEPYSAGEFSIDDYRPMKVICIGAGFSGILAAIRFRQKVPNLDLKIYEKADGVGGTWRANRYPGAACDVPSHCYQFSFEDQVPCFCYSVKAPFVDCDYNSQWSSLFSTGPEILANIERIVDKYKIRKYMNFNHELTHAKWDASSGQWIIRVRHGDEELQDSCDVLLLCIGSLSRWHWPEVEGLKEFGGTLVHSAQWNVGDGASQEEVENWRDKTVGIIGNVGPELLERLFAGSSGIQIAATIHPKIKKMVTYARQRTWIPPPFFVNTLMSILERDPTDTNMAISDEEREKLKDPKQFKSFRHTIEQQMNSFHALVIRESEIQKQAKKNFEERMRQGTAAKPGLLEKMLPTWSVFCRRLTPGEGYLEALCADNTTYETTPIKRVTRAGIELTDGRVDELDVLVCATGFDVSYHYPFDVVGRGGITLNERWSPYAEAYLSLAVDGFPNMFLVYGPGSGLNSGSFFVMVESQMQYVVKAVQKLQAERLKSMEPKKEATTDWTEHMRAYFPKTVYMDTCNSWYKAPDGTVVGLWPGSSLHAIRALANPRWEDYEYESMDKTHNRLQWLGAGHTENERTMTGDLAWYLNAPDVPPIPE